MDDAELRRRLLDALLSEDIPLDDKGAVHRAAKRVLQQARTELATSHLADIADKRSGTLKRRQASRLKTLEGIANTWGSAIGALELLRLSSIEAVSQPPVHPIGDARRALRGLYDFAADVTDEIIP